MFVHFKVVYHVWIYYQIQKKNELTEKVVWGGGDATKPYQNMIRQVAQGARELKKLLVKPPNKLDEEAEVQQKSCHKVQAKLRKERGNCET